MIVACRQSQDYDEKAERQIAFATDNDDAATSERELAGKEEKRARDSAFLAADVKSRIDKILEAGRDQARPPMTCYYELCFVKHTVPFALL